MSDPEPEPEKIKPTTELRKYNTRGILIAQILNIGLYSVLIAYQNYSSCKAKLTHTQLLSFELILVCWIFFDVIVLCTRHKSEHYKILRYYQIVLFLSTLASLGVLIAYAVPKYFNKSMKTKKNITYSFVVGVKFIILMIGLILVFKK